MERKRPAPCCEDCEMLHLHLTSRGRELLRVKATVALRCSILNFLLFTTMLTPRYFAVFSPASAPWLGGVAAPPHSAWRPQYWLCAVCRCVGRVRCWPGGEGRLGRGGNKSTCNKHYTMGPGPGLVAHVLWRYCMRLASSGVGGVRRVRLDASRMQYRHKTCATSPGPGPIVYII